jgi:hypothetical protein
MKHKFDDRRDSWVSWKLVSNPRWYGWQKGDGLPETNKQIKRAIKNTTLYEFLVKRNKMQ